MVEGKKKQVLNEIFNKIRARYPESPVLKFNNDLVKEVSGSYFRNQFDVTKCDTPDILPKNIVDEGYFIVHLGKGNHAFIKGEGYHNFEKIKEIKDWKGGLSRIDDISESEAQSASTAFNEKIIHDFLFGDIKKEIKLHTARRAKISYDFKIGEESLKANTLQIEIDGIYESEEDKTIASLEVKNKNNDCFEIRQLFSAMKYLKQKIPEEYNIRLLFMVRIRKKEKDSFLIYEYKFEDEEDPNSIKFVNAVQYNIENEYFIQQALN